DARAAGLDPRDRREGLAVRGGLAPRGLDDGRGRAGPAREEGGLHVGLGPERREPGGLGRRRGTPPEERERPRARDREGDRRLGGDAARAAGDDDDVGGPEGRAPARRERLLGELDREAAL